MKKFRSNTFFSQKGSSVVEFALVLPILLLILFGIINYGILFFNQSVITNAAREGARWAAIHSSSTYGTSCTNTSSLTPIDPCQVAFGYASEVLISFAGKQLNVSYMAGNYNKGTAQSITVNYSYTGIGWFFGGLDNKLYSATSIMLHE